MRERGKNARSSSTNITQTSNNTARIQRRPRQNRRAKEEQRTQSRRLARIERQPESMLQHRVLRARRHNANHTADRPNQANTEYNPGVGRHYSEGCAGTEEVAGTEGGEGEAAAGVLEG